MDSLEARFANESVDIMDYVLKDAGLSHSTISDAVDDAMMDLTHRVINYVLTETVEELKAMHGMTEEELMALATDYSDLEEFVADLPESIKNYNKLVNL